MNNINSLPAEVLEKIFLFCDQKSQKKDIPQVCHLWNEIHQIRKIVLSDEKRIILLNQKEYKHLKKISNYFKQLRVFLSNETPVEKVDLKPLLQTIYLITNEIARKVPELVFRCFSQGFGAMIFHEQNQFSNLDVQTHLFVQKMLEFIDKKLELYNLNENFKLLETVTNDKNTRKKIIEEIAFPHIKSLIAT